MMMLMVIMMIMMMMKKNKCQETSQTAKMKVKKQI